MWDGVGQGRKMSVDWVLRRVAGLKSQRFKQIDSQKFPMARDEKKLWVFFEKQRLVDFWVPWRPLPFCRFSKKLFGFWFCHFVARYIVWKYKSVNSDGLEIDRDVDALLRYTWSNLLLIEIDRSYVFRTALRRSRVPIQSCSWMPRWNRWLWMLASLPWKSTWGRIPELLSIVVLWKCF